MIKRAVKKVFSVFGFELKRKSNQQAVPAEKKDVIIEVAGKKIIVDAEHPFATLYIQRAGYNSELGRLAKIMYSKYPHIGVIDVGANVGDTLCIIKNSIPGPVICVEGDTELFTYLSKNAAQFDDTILHNVFLGEKHSSMSVITEKDGWNTTIIPANKEESKSKLIEFFTLDEIAERTNNIQTFKLLKTDTEGYDVKIIRGGIEYLKEVKPVILMEYNRDNMRQINENGFDTLMLLKNIGYNIVAVYESGGRFILSTTLDSVIMTQLHNYIDGRNSGIYYFDLCIFHEEDKDIGEAHINTEEKLNML
jgi:FkbM family methyltransferase